MEVREVATKKPKLSVYLDEGLKADIERLAKVENRSVNNLIETLLRNEVIKATQEGRM